MERTGSSERRTAVLALMLPDVPVLSIHRTASHVVQRGLELDTKQGERDFIVTLLEAQSPHSLKEVATTRYGSFIVEHILTKCETWARHAVFTRLAPCLLEIQASQFGERVVKPMQLVQDSPFKGAKQVFIPEDGDGPSIAKLLMSEEGQRTIIVKLLEREIENSKEGERAIIDKLLEAQSPHALKDMAMTRYGSFIVEHILTRCEALMAHTVRVRLAPALPDIQASTFGPRVARAMQAAQDDPHKSVTPVFAPEE